jgi:hypothetical protein
MSFENHVNSVENNEIKKELNREDKKNLEHFWREIVLGVNDVDEINAESMDRKELRQWLYGTLVNEIELITSELGFVPGNDLIENIAKEGDQEKKSYLQLEYIFECNKQFNAFSRANESSASGNNTRWSTMPLTIRENKSFNCVGASLIGHDLLEKADIENFFGNPAGHVVNMVRLDNGDWWFVDFRNNFIQKVKPEVIEIGKVKSLKLSDNSNMYKYVPMLEGMEMPSFILGNLSVLVKEANDESIVESNPNKKVAKDLFNRFNAEFEENKLGFLNSVLYPEARSISESEIMDTERERVRRFSKLCADFFAPISNKFNKETRDVIHEEMKIKRGLAMQFFNDDVLSDDMSDNMKTVLLMCRNNLHKLRENDTETYNEFADTLIAVILL